MPALLVFLFFGASVAYLVCSARRDGQEARGDLEGAAAWGKAANACLWVFAGVVALALARLLRFAFALAG